MLAEFQAKLSRLREG
ncbi:hypothetical protein, partial [Hydrogenibacillus schlegelii]